MTSSRTWRRARCAAALAGLALCSICASFGAELTIVVVDDTGQPIAGARASLRGEIGAGGLSRGDGRTDQTGTLRLTDVGPGRYRLTVTASGHTDARQDVTVPPRVPLRVEVRLPRGCRINGRVTLPSGQPAADVTANIYFLTPQWHRGITGVRIAPDGTYSVSWQWPERCNIVLKATGYAAVERGDVELVPAGETSDFDFILDAPAGTITGAVYQPDGRTPRADALVCGAARLSARLSLRDADRIHHAGVNFVTDEDGRYRLESLPPGRYEIEVKRTDGAGTAERFTLAEAEAATRLDFHLTETPTLTVLVLGPDGKPATDAAVALWKETALGRYMRHASPGAVHADGRLRFNDLLHGAYWVTVTCPRAAQQRVGSINVQGAEPIPELRVTLKQGATIQLRQRRDGSEGPTGITEVVQTDAGGRFSLAVDHGIHGAKFIARGLTPATVAIDTESPAELSVTVRLGPETGIRGVALAQEAEIPPQGLYVFAVRPARYAYMPQAADRGPRPSQGVTTVMPGETDWEILGLEPGDYDVFTYAPGLAPSVPSQVTVAEGEIAETMVDVAVPGTVTGQVLTADREPIADVLASAMSSGGRVRDVPLSGRTDAEGRYRIDGLTPGVVTVRISTRSRGYVTPLPQETMVMPGVAIENVDFELLVGGEVTGIVKRRDGAPLTSQYYAALDVGPGRRRIVRVNADGSFTIDHVYPGVYDLAVSRRDDARLQLIATREAIVVAEGMAAEGIEFIIDE